MKSPDMSNYYWQGSRIRLRAMTREDLNLWLEEDTDTEGIRFLILWHRIPEKSVISR